MELLLRVSFLSIQTLAPQLHQKLKFAKASQFSASTTAISPILQSEVLQTCIATRDDARKQLYDVITHFSDVVSQLPLDDRLVFVHWLEGRGLMYYIGEEW